MNHEDWTCRILLGDTCVNKVLLELGEDFPERVASVIRKTYDKPIVMNLVTSPLDADRMDYLLRDAYYTGVNYGTIDIDRILRMLRPHRDRIVVKESGMHAVEDYLMSRYQMYWQVYFHPVTRSSEIILRQIFRRAKELYEAGYAFQFMIEPLPALFEGRLTVQQYLRLDEALIQTAFLQWTAEQDQLLSELCGRFIHRKLYKYIEIDTGNPETIDAIRQAFREAGLDPAYDVEIDFPTDLPYDKFHSGMPLNEKQILLLDRHDQLREISEVSDIVRSISGIHKGRNYLYYPEERVEPLLDRMPAEVADLFRR